MRGCSAIKRNGERCRAIAATGSDYCYSHDPAYSEARSRAASKAAKSKGGSARAEVQTVKDQVKVVIGGALAGKIDRSVASVALQGYNVLLRATEIERRLRETEEFEERLRALEEAAAQRHVPYRGGRFGS